METFEESPFVGEHVLGDFEFDGALFGAGGEELFDIAELVSLFGGGIAQGGQGGVKDFHVVGNAREAFGGGAGMDRVEGAAEFFAQVVEHGGELLGERLNGGGIG